MRADRDLIAFELEDQLIYSSQNTYGQSLPENTMYSYPAADRGFDLWRWIALQTPVENMVSLQETNTILNPWSWRRRRQRGKAAKLRPGVMVQKEKGSARHVCLFYKQAGSTTWLAVQQQSTSTIETKKEQSTSCMFAIDAPSPAKRTPP